MFLIPEGQLAGRLVCSPSDLVQASTCEYGFATRLDEKLGRAPVFFSPDDEMLARTAALGDAHEAAELARLHRQYPGQVVEIDRPRTLSAEGIGLQVAATVQALQGGAQVVFQAVFFDPQASSEFAMYGMADFIQRRDQTGGTSVHEVVDTKLARRAKPQALLQIAFYAEQLQRLGFDPGPDLFLLLGNQQRVAAPTDEVLAVMQERRAHLGDLVAKRLAVATPADWQDDSLRRCGGCDYCLREIAAQEDLWQVAGLRANQRSSLRQAGIFTVSALAKSAGAVPGLAQRQLEVLRSQAQLQTGTQGGDGEVNGVRYRLVDAAPILTLPPPSPGDIYFDFEGDPLWVDASGREWHLDYLFGWVTADGNFEYLWADDLAAEREAFTKFMTYLSQRLEEYPDLHVYHYAPYERTHLLSLAVRHQIFEEQVDQLLRDGVLVDLYATVRQSLQVSEQSYSIKKMEPLYMGADLRGGTGPAQVVDAGASVVAYANYTAALVNGDQAAAQQIADSILDYNHYDCRSTLKLSEWLRSLAQAHPEHFDQAAARLANAAHSSGGAGGGIGQEALVTNTPAQLQRLADAKLEASFTSRYPGPQDPTRSAQQQAKAMVGASVNFHRREAKPFWWEHFSRLSLPPDEWPNERNFLLLEQVQVLEDWHLPERARTLQRKLRARTSVPVGSVILADDAAECIYRAVDVESRVPVPPNADKAGFGRASGFSVHHDGEHEWIEFTERLAKGNEDFHSRPMALVATPGPNPAPLQASLRSLAEAELAKDPSQRPTLEASLLAREAPRLLPGHRLIRPSESAGIDQVTALTDSLLALDESYLAVQGPPGTGKTYLASHVIARLVSQGWRIGVVAQSHAVVENVLAAVVKAGVAKDHVFKKAKTGSKAEGADNTAWTVLPSKDEAFLVALAEPGIVLGGTAWDFANENRFPARRLDLLVIDEAGQYSLANTLACTRAAKNLLLLGDPQQLDQVVTGTHPEAVDHSALGWIIQGKAVLPEQYGYFLDQSWRMHPQVSRVVSRLSYEGKLRSAPAASQRELADVSPGVFTHFVAHAGRSVSSPEEANGIGQKIVELLGSAWRAKSDEPARALTQHDFLVVAAYNAQVALIQNHLASLGLDQVRVGTVDKFQGQEAPVVLVSLAASDPAEIPRGIEFLLNRNRINVAISRAQWVTYIFRSPKLTDLLPNTVAGLVDLGAFLLVSETWRSQPGHGVPNADKTLG